ncbi:hypothetical protein [Pedobacter nototheniae]|uniref:hypothetical protein n=1 Tax=Pedobacter nototheniae TaxID=2488994 RepID=UPI00292CF63B|nr:hypothetical protein [Pedobacter nototheniae]
MKKIITICFLALIGLVSCKKESTDKKNNNNLMGTWEVEKMLEIRYENDVEKNRYEDKYSANEMLFVFEGDNVTVKNNNDAGEVYSYTLKGEEFVMTKGNTSQYLNLKFNSNAQMVLSLEDSNVDSKGIKHRNVSAYTLNKK